jgi:cytochrome c556
VGKVQALALALVISAAGFGAWLHEHDKRVRWQGKAEAQTQQLKKDQSDLDAFRKTVASLDQAYAKARKRHEVQIDQLKQTKRTYTQTIDSLINELARETPDSIKPKLVALGEMCSAQADTIFKSLTDCEALRVQAEEQVSRRDTIIFKIQGQRDSYKRLYEESRDFGPPSFWNTVGKTETAMLLIAIVTKLTGVW